MPYPASGLLPALAAMKPIEPPDLHHLRAGMGWLELGNHREANEELKQIAPVLQVHPDVLEIRWEIVQRISDRPR